ncbi:hypothetical protein RZ67_07395 [[Haemophilus] ducreyi]|nr:hypothetical protein RZ66_07620 [[Haemophilus] ducreyi]AKO47487.1 hypothetical protein RZ67_07395 [[Haemophilus] ducreyi]AKO48870.1 hypothetical protein RZ68_07475 [[Haemophilus] ducreyi]AKO50235.1 hypothetical protein RZ69_07425 [[Haemophilus] ducreyi]
MYSHFSSFQLGALAQSKNLNPSIALSLEATGKIAPNTELGLGVGFIKRKNFNFAKTWRATSYDNQAETPNGSWLGNEKYKINRYTSLPIYLILKQNFRLNDEMRLYVKGDLGYSFNKIKNTHYTLHTEIINNSDLPKEYTNTPIDMNAKNGSYYSLSVGAEYKHFLAEIGYYRTNVSLFYKGHGKFIDPSFPQADSRRDYNINKTSSYSNNAIRLSIGFKF